MVAITLPGSESAATPIVGCWSSEATRTEHPGGHVENLFGVAPAEPLSSDCKAASDALALCCASFKSFSWALGSLLLDTDAAELCGRDPQALLLAMLLEARLRFCGEARDAAVDGVEAPQASGPATKSCRSNFSSDSFASLSACEKLGSITGFFAHESLHDAFATPSLLPAETGLEPETLLGRPETKLRLEVGRDQSASQAAEELISSNDPSDATDILEGRRTSGVGG